MSYLRGRLREASHRNTWRNSFQLVSICLWKGTFDLVFTQLPELSVFTNWMQCFKHYSIVCPSSCEICIWHFDFFEGRGGGMGHTSPLKFGNSVFSAHFWQILAIFRLIPAILVTTRDGGINEIWATPTPPPLPKSNVWIRLCKVY